MPKQTAAEDYLDRAANLRRMSDCGCPDCKHILTGYSPEAITLLQNIAGAAKGCSVRVLRAVVEDWPAERVTKEFGR